MVWPTVNLKGNSNQWRIVLYWFGIGSDIPQICDLHSHVYVHLCWVHAISVSSKTITTVPQKHTTHRHKERKRSIFLNSSYKSRETHPERHNRFVPLHLFSKPDVPTAAFHLRVYRVKAERYWERKWTCGNTDPQRGTQTGQALRRKAPVTFPMGIFRGNESLVQDIFVEMMLHYSSTCTQHGRNDTQSQHWP